MALKRRVEVRFEAGQYQRLEKIAHDRGQSVAELIREAVENQYLEPGLADKRRAIERLLELDLPVGPWEEVKEALIKERSRDIEAS